VRPAGTSGSGARLAALLAWVAALVLYLGLGHGLDELASEHAPSGVLATICLVVFTVAGALALAPPAAPGRLRPLRVGRAPQTTALADERAEARASPARLQVFQL
jgi:hypothetical protein